MNTTFSAKVRTVLVISLQRFLYLCFCLCSSDWIWSGRNSAGKRWCQICWWTRHLCGCLLLSSKLNSHLVLIREYLLPLLQSGHTTRWYKGAGEPRPPRSALTRLLPASWIVGLGLDLLKRICASKRENEWEMSHFKPTRFPFHSHLLMWCMFCWIRTQCREGPFKSVKVPLYSKMCFHYCSSTVMCALHYAEWCMCGVWY